MPTTHLSVLGLDIQRVITPSEAVVVDTDRVRLVRDEADPEQGRDPDNCTPGASRASAHATKAVTERLTGRNVADEVRLPFTASFERLYVAATDLLRGAAVGGDAQVNLMGTLPQVAVAFYAARTTPVDGGELSHGTAPLLTISAIDRPDLAVIDDLWSLAGDVEAASDAFDEFRRTSSGLVAMVVARPLHIAPSDPRGVPADVNGESRPNPRTGRIAGVRGACSGGDSSLGAMSFYVGHACEQLADLVESGDPRPDPEDTHDPNAVLDALDMWPDGGNRPLVSTGGDLYELVACFRTSCEARFGRLEDWATVRLLGSLDRFEAHFDVYLDVRSRLSAAAGPVAEWTTELFEQAAEATTSFPASDNSGPTTGKSALELNGYILSLLGDFEVAVLPVLAAGPPCFRSWTRHGIATEFRERAGYHGIIAGARDDKTWSASDSLYVGVTRDSVASGRFEERLSDALAPRPDVAIEGFTTNGLVTAHERERGRDALESTGTGRLWVSTTGWESFRETVIGNLLRGYAGCDKGAADA